MNTLRKTRTHTTLHHTTIRQTLRTVYTKAMMRRIMLKLKEGTM